MQFLQKFRAFFHLVMTTVKNRRHINHVFSDFSASMKKECGTEKLTIKRRRYGGPFDYRSVTMQEYFHAETRSVLLIRDDSNGTADQVIATWAQSCLGFPCVITVDKQVTACSDIDTLRGELDLLLRRSFRSGCSRNGT